MILASGARSPGLNSRSSPCWQLPQQALRSCRKRTRGEYHQFAICRAHCSDVKLSLTHWKSRSSERFDDASCTLTASSSLPRSAISSKCSFRNFHVGSGPATSTNLYVHPPPAYLAGRTRERVSPYLSCYLVSLLFIYLLSYYSPALSIAATAAKESTAIARSARSFACRPNQK